MNEVHSPSVVQSSRNRRWIAVGVLGLFVLLLAFTQWARSDRTSPEADSPLLGEATGLGLIYGGPGFGPLKLLDLDSGIVHQLGATGEPIGVVDSSLVTRRSGSVSFYQLDSVDAEPVVVQSERGPIQVLSVTEDRLWTISGDREPEWWLAVGYDQSGTRAEAMNVALSFPFLGFSPSSEFVPGESGGIYQKDGDDLRQVSDGTLVATGDEFNLVRECDERLECALNWYRGDDWVEPLDMPTPELPDQGQVAFSPNDRWLVVTDPTNVGTELYDVRTGRLVRTIRVSRRLILNSVGLSSDGRWLIEEGFGKTTVVDLESGTEWPQDIRSEAAVFVDLLVVDFAG